MLKEGEIFSLVFYLLTRLSVENSDGRWDEGLNQEPFCCDVTVLTTVTQCHAKTQQQQKKYFKYLNNLTLHIIGFMLSAITSLTITH